MRQFRVYYGEDLAGFYWPSSQQKRTEWLTIKRNKPAEAQSIYQCAPGSREGTIFLESDFAYYAAPATLSLGVESPAVRKFLERGHMVATGWDTAFEATSTADFTAGLPALFIPCSKYHCGEDPLIFGECDPHFDVLILDMVHEKLTWADLVPAFRRIHKKWEPFVHVVEKRGAGISLYQAMPLVGINVIGENPIESKRARAIQGVGAGSVQGWFRQHRVLFPLNQDGTEPVWVTKIKDQLKDFSGAKDAEDDIADAIVHLVSYAIRVGGGAAVLPQSEEIERLERTLEAPTTDSRVQFFAWLGEAPGLSEDIFAHTCGRCDNNSQGFCKVYRRKIIAIDGAECLEFRHAD